MCLKSYRTIVHFTTDVTFEAWVGERVGKDKFNMLLENSSLNFYQRENDIADGFLNFEMKLQLLGEKCTIGLHFVCSAIASNFESQLLI